MPGPTHSPGEVSAEGGGRLIDFPRERGSKPPPNNLPLQLTSFIGREQEITDLGKLLATEARLVTLTGPGGSGKTRLALAVASGLVEAFEDGVWWVELASLSDPDIVWQAVASVLSVREVPGRSMTDAYVEYLEEREVLLLLDNCEHLVASCATLCDVLLHACPKLKILTTSREALEVAGETHFAVPPLSSPDPNALSTGKLEGFESVRLFVERARYRRPEFALESENASSIAEVCYGLDGIPLAIELAAARVGTLSVTQISDRLERSLGLLSGRDRTAPERQRTLRAALDWSYELLDEAERKLFGRLSVFAGGFTLEAAEAICAGDETEPDVVLDLLEHVIDKSLVVAETGEEDALRYRLLETIRQYGMEKLAEFGEAGKVRRRHAEYYLALAEEAEPELSGSCQRIWLEKLEAERDNFRAVLSWALESGEANLGLRLAGALGEFWHTHGPLSEGRRWLEMCLSGEDGASSPYARAKALNEAGWITVFQGEAGTVLLEESLALFKELGDKAGIASALANLGQAAGLYGDIERVRALREEAEALRREPLDPRAILKLLQFLGAATYYEGDQARLVALTQENLALSRKLGDMRSVVTCLILLGMISLTQDDHEVAAPFEEALRLSHNLGDELNVFYCLLGLAGWPALGENRPARRGCGEPRRSCRRQAVYDRRPSIAPSTNTRTE
jgi:predicted ATPase